MAGFGYHPPQFSEDMAWLPEWLHPHQVLLSPEQVKDAQALSQVTCKDAVFLEENASYGGDDHLFSKGDAKYTSLHLFLSGDGHSTAGNTPSSGNVLQFRLHLSSDDISQYSLSEPHAIVQTEKKKLNGVESMQSIHETSVVKDDVDYQYKLDGQTCPSDLLPSSCKANVSSKCPLQPINNNRKRRKKLQDKIDSHGLQNADVKDAVELSISASEALAISELMKSGLPEETLPAAAILEVALQLKQARNQCCFDGFEDGSSCPDDDFDDNDKLSDLDEITMADAFEDVGLSVLQVVANPENLCVDGKERTSSSQKHHTHSSHTESSYVPNTHLSERCCGCDEQNVELKSQDAGFNGIPFQNKLETGMELRTTKSPSKSLDTWWKKPCEAKSFLGSNASTVESDSNACASQLAHATPNALALEQLPSNDETKGIDLDVESTKLVHTQSSMVSYCWLGDSGKAELENSANGVAAERFRSRWLGGWTGKNFEVTVHGGCNSIKSMPKNFIRETSFLSESMDVNVDENSVQKPEGEPNIVVSASISLESFQQKTNVGMPSQDLVGSSTFSLSDPLCSFVPCSITLDGLHVDQVPYKNDFRKEPGQLLNPIMAFNAEAATPSVSVAYEEQQIAPKTSGEISKVSRKHLNSLKIYSTGVSLRHDGPDGELLYCSDSTGLECTTKRTTPKPILDSVVEKTTGTDTAKEDIEVQFHQFENSCSPLILNYGTRRRLHAFNIVASDTKEESSKQALISCTGKAQLDNSRSELTSRDQTNVTSFAPLDSSLHLHSHEKKSLTRKRVCFSEAGGKCHRNNTGQKPPSGYLTRSSTKSGKRKKDFSLKSKFGTRKENSDSLQRFDKTFGKGLLFQGLEFLLTGLSSSKKKELKMLIGKHGGVVLSDVPSPSPYLRRKRQSRCQEQQCPIVLSPKKVQTPKFLYGCAINTLLLRTSWLSDSIEAGALLPPKKYLILSNQAAYREQMQIGQPINCSNFIFERVGIMFYGKPSFCSKLGNIVKHGGGQVFKTLHWLVLSLKNGKNSVGAIVVEDEDKTSRHLRQCASEQRLQMMPASWIINSLLSGKLRPSKVDQSAPLHTIKMPKFPVVMDMSEEI